MLPYLFANHLNTTLLACWLTYTTMSIANSSTQLQSHSISGPSSFINDGASRRFLVKVG